MTGCVFGKPSSGQDSSCEYRTDSETRLATRFESPPFHVDFTFNQGHANITRMRLVFVSLQKDLVEGLVAGRTLF